MNEKIFLLEDDAYLRDGLSEMLSGQGYAVTATETISQARGIIASCVFDLIILDVMLPDGSGLDLCASLRASGVTSPILFLTACDDEINIVKGLDSGADDYVTKPFKLLELMSRVRALIRRSGNNLSLVSSDGIVIDMNNMTVKKNNETIFLTKTEFQILCCLIRNSGVIVTRDTLLKNIWDESGNFIYDNTLSVHMSRLREKIGFEHIVTVRGVGYRWEDAR
ncbi:response regulator transcription factor [uncultured Eubacterium sp.]|uniref:response regulator transcription factor n=1 Tax=uncultured Eubacterium sp. TaxID=165185 RepID=UPI0015AE2FC1|nr:response regulator transcription factor [uncultured Eubacterium sp.]